MSAAVGQALEQALAFWRAPALLAGARQRPLPEDVLEVVRIAAGDRAAAEFAAAALGTTPGEMADAAPFYLQQLLFAPGADSYRVLGVNPDAPDARIKEHYRWLVRWLHPDRNTDEWEAVYADRVNRAWQDLRQPERRAAYDASLSTGGAGHFTPVGAPSGATLRVAAPTDEPLLSARTTQRLPIFVLGGFGLLAGAVLALMWYAQNPRVPRSVKAPPVLVAEPAPEAVRAAEAESPSPPAPGPLPPMPVPLIVAAPAPPPPASPETSRLAAAPALPPAPTTASAPTNTPAYSRVVSPAARPATPVPAAAPSPEPAAAPEITAPPTAPPPPPPAPITEPEALAVLERFTRAYAAGDLRALMRLFTRDASNNRGDRMAIAYDYQELFDQSESRELQLRPNGWRTGDTGATVLAGFEARVKYAGSWRAARSEGDIRFDLAREDGELRIRNIRHDER